MARSTIRSPDRWFWLSDTVSDASGSPSGKRLLAARTWVAMDDPFRDLPTVRPRLVFHTPAGYTLAGYPKTSQLLGQQTAVIVLHVLVLRPKILGRLTHLDGSPSATAT